MSMEKLLMQVALIDQVTKPLKGITKQMNATVDAGRQGMANMASGGAGLVAAGFAIQSALMPAIEMDRKIGEVKSLGVTDDALKQLSNTALGFSIKYGKSATDFVAASYDIQSAIAGLNGDELSQFTKASAVLAAATKADTGTITNYMGTMYGIFKNQANKMGKGEWVEQVAGMTASAVQMFKTTGSEMSSAFTSVGADATSVGVGMNEQMAVLGTLQATMSGSEAGTKYRAFLGGVANAQDKLNMSFTDSQGQMLPMLDILEQLKGRYGDTIDVAESAELAKAFGTKEATGMIKLLMADTDGLGKSIEQLGEVQGMGKAEEMAASMTDQWERLQAVWFAVRASVFGAVLPAINAVVGSMVDGMSVIVGWVDEFPLLGKILGWVAIAGISLGGVVAGLSLAMGIGQMMSAGWALTMGTLNGAFKMLRLSTLLTTASTWLFNAALWANPITWIVGGVIALGAAVVGIIYYWDDLSAAMTNAVVGIMSYWNDFMSALNDIWIFRKIGELFSWIGSVAKMVVDFQLSCWAKLFNFIGNVFSSVANFVVGVVDDLIFAWQLFSSALINTAFVQYIISAFNQLSNFVVATFNSVVSITTGAWQLIGAGVDLFLLPFKIAFTAIKAFFTLLTDGPEAAFSVLGGVVTLFTDIIATVCNGWQLMADGFMGFISAIGDLSVFQLIGDGIDWLIDKINMIPGIDIDTNIDGAELPTSPEAPAVEAAKQAENTQVPPMLSLVPQSEASAVEVAKQAQVAQVPPMLYLVPPQSAVLANNNEDLQSVAPYKQPQNQTPLPQSMVKNVTTTNKQQGGTTRNFGNVTINTQQPLTPDQLAEWDELSAG